MKTTARPLSRRRYALLGIVLIGGVLAPGLALQAEAAKGDSTKTSSQSDRPVEDGEKTGDDEEKERQRNRVIAGLLVVGGIVMVGVAIITGALLWGARTRRIARQRGECSAQHDPLWYLRKGASKSADAVPQAEPKSDDEIDDPPAGSA